MAPAPPSIHKAERANYAAWRAAIVALPPDDRARLAHLFAPAAIAAARSSARAELMLQLAIGRTGDRRAIAQAAHRDLQRYAETRWRRGDCDRAAPRDPADAVAHQLLCLTRGAVPAAETLRKALRGVGGKTPGTAHALVRQVHQPDKTSVNGD